MEGFGFGSFDWALWGFELRGWWWCFEFVGGTEIEIEVEMLICIAVVWRLALTNWKVRKGQDSNCLANELPNTKILLHYLKK
jgi:hypothetical protein